MNKLLQTLMTRLTGAELAQILEDSGYTDHGVGNLVASLGVNSSGQAVYEFKYLDSETDKIEKGRVYVSASIDAGGKLHFHAEF